MLIDYGETSLIGTVYLMGSMYSTYYNDIVGLTISIKQGDPNNHLETQCKNKVNGSGFYHCGANGQILILSMEGEYKSFTICEVAIYSEYNIISAVSDSE